MPEPKLSNAAVVDLRSDTVTRPTPEMLEAMVAAKVGDDCFRDDPTVIELEAAVAQRLGKAAGLFVPSGTMANQIAVRVFGQPGEEIVVAQDSHLFNFEVGALGTAFVQTRALPMRGGLYDEAELSRSLRRGDVHCPATALVCFENTHNFAGGIAVGPEAFARQAALARRVGAAVYLDGARLFDAAIALGVSAEDLAAPADAVMVCLSKSLGAPAGSVLCGSDAFIAKALRWRQRMGGGMRQAGYLAACGLVALRDGIERLAEDHRRARGLAEDIGKVAGLVVHRDPTLTYTNMVFFDLDAKAPFRAAELERRCAAEGVLLVAVGSNTMRLVCHRDIDDDAAQRAIAVLRQVLAASG